METSIGDQLPPFESRPEYVFEDLQTLSNLWERWGNSDATSAGRDEASFRALRTAASLVTAIAGWALDHRLNACGMPRARLGDAKEGQPNVEEEDFEARSLRARRYLIDFLDTMGWVLRVPPEVIEGVQALEYGQVLPVFRPAQKGDRLGLTARRARLAALVYVEFEHQKTGIKKEYLWEEVAKVFAINPASAKDWRAELRQSLGATAVDDWLEVAREAGKECRDPNCVSRDQDEKWFGAPALAKAAAAYKLRAT